MEQLKKVIEVYIGSYIDKGYISERDVQNLLDALRESMSLKNADLLEFDVDHESLYVSFSSVDNGEKSMVDTRFPAPIVDGKIIRSFFDEDGLSDSFLGDHNIMLPGSLLQYCIIQNNCFYGLLGIRAGQKGRVWTKEERKVLLRVGRLLVPFVMSRRKTSSVDELQHTTEKMDLLAEAVPGGFKIWQDDERKTILYLAEKAAAIQGYSINEFYEKCHGSMNLNIHPEDRLSALEQIKKEYEEGDIYRVKYRVICKDGSSKWIMDIGKKITDEKGKILNYSLVTDITKTEEQERLYMRERRRYHDSLVANAKFSYELDLTDGMVRHEIIMSDGRPMVGFINQSLPIHYDELCRLSMQAMNFKLLDEKTAPYWTRQGLLNAFAKGEMNAECEYYSAADDKYYRNSALMSLDETDGHVYSIMMCTDITEQKKEQERNKEKLQEAFEEANKANRAKSDFLSSMSHEIRTPMNAIIGLTDVLLRKDLPNDVIEYLMNIKSSGNALLSLINDLLDFSKIEAGKFTIVPNDYDIAQMLKDIQIIGQSRVGDKGVMLRFDVDSNLPRYMNGDSLRIRQVLINIMNNAIKYTDKGSVTVSIKEEKRENNKIKLGFSIKDTGIGIKKEDLDKLFDAFYQVDLNVNKGKEGTGLGLAISEQLVSLMGGNILVESEYGKGSIFSYSIWQTIIEDTPVGNFNALISEKVDKSFLEFDFTAEGANILVVEDNIVNQTVINAVLEPLHMNIECAGNGQEAIDMAKDKQYDLILMDHYMPVKNGFEATKEIRMIEGDYYKYVPIIALTADAIQSNRHLFLEAGMDDISTKPLEIPLIGKMLKKWLPEKLIQMKS